MKLTTTALCFVFLACLESGLSTRSRAQGEQGYSGSSIHNSRGFKRLPQDPKSKQGPHSPQAPKSQQAPKSEHSPKMGLRRRIPGVIPFANRSRSFSAMTCQDVQCPQLRQCEMRNATCAGNTPCMFPVCVTTPMSFASTADNPGECPMSAVDATGQCIDSQILCTNDSVCALNQKCCFNLCDLVCTNVTSMANARFRAMLPRRSRTFSSGRSRTRVASMNAMFCPTVPAGVLSNACSSMGCSSDANCTGSQKCCALSCGKACISAVNIVGVAQRQQAKAMESMRAIYAASANASASGNASATPAAAASMMMSKIGVCPTVAVDANLTGVASCGSLDSECPGEMKCCVHGQGMGCFDRIQFGGRLPDPLTSTRMTARHMGGSPHTLLSLRAACPNIGSSTGFSCASPCTHDSNCTDTELCCSVGGCRVCMNPVISNAFANARPGLCPQSPPDLVTTCQVDCEFDSSCPGRMRCCGYGCSRRCVNPVASMAPSFKAGNCPAPSSMTGMFTMGKKGGQSHGSRRWRRRGQGGGRAAAKAMNPCAYQNFNQCSMDSGCSGAQKCCPNTCGRNRCVMPA